MVDVGGACGGTAVPDGETQPRGDEPPAEVDPYGAAGPAGRRELVTEACVEGVPLEIEATLVVEGVGQVDVQHGRTVRWYVDRSGPHL
jgi:hypothetical protein